MKENKILQAGKPAGASLQCQTDSPHRILVVDDDLFIRQLNADVLIRNGYAVNTAADGAAGWEALNADCYDLLITDNNMPKLNGVELLKKLRAARMALPVIMATGTLPIPEFTRNPWLQPAAVLLKPYTIAEFLGTVNGVLRVPDDAPDQIASLPNRQSQPSTDGLQL